MPHHTQFKKSLRKEAKRRTANRSQRARLRHAMRHFRTLTKVEEAEAALPKVVSLLDKGAKTHLIHARTADRLKSRLTAALNRMRVQA